MYAFCQLSDTSLISLTVQIDENTGQDGNIRQAKAENTIFFINSSFSCEIHLSFCLSTLSFVPL